MIHSLCPDAELYMARITQSGLQTPFNMVPEADIAAGIQWCVDQGVKIVNVSYGISAVEGELTEACHNAAQAEVIVIASHSNVNGALVYPAAFKNVVGVYRSRTAKLGEISVSSLENMDVAAFGGPFYVGAASHGVSYMGGTSFAGAQVSAVLGQILERRSELTIAEAFATLLCLEVSENELRASK